MPSRLYDLSPVNVSKLSASQTQSFTGPDLRSLSTEVAKIPARAQFWEWLPLAYGWSGKDTLWYAVTTKHGYDSFYTFNTKTQSETSHVDFSKKLHLLLDKLTPDMDVKTIRVDGNSISFIVSALVGPPEALVTATLDGRQWHVNPQLETAPDLPWYQMPIPYCYIEELHSWTTIGESHTKSVPKNKRYPVIVLMNVQNPKQVKEFTLETPGENWNLLNPYCTNSRMHTSVMLLFVNNERTMASSSILNLVKGKQYGIQKYEMPAFYWIEEAQVSPDGKFIAWFLATRATKTSVPVYTRELWISKTDSANLRRIGSIPAKSAELQANSIRWVTGSSGLSYLVDRTVYLVSRGRLVQQERKTTNTSN